MLRSSALLLACLAPHRSSAQATTTLLPNAAVLAPRDFRFRLLTAWTRYDEFFTDSSSKPLNLAASFNTDSLGSAQLPVLSTAESAIRTLAAQPAFRLTAGQLVAAANSRVVTAPLVIEYGLTRHITIGVVVPLVETRTTLRAQLNPHTGLANVGPNPAALGNAGAVSANNAVVLALSNARTELAKRYANCQSSPSGSGCSAILADGQSVLQLSSTFQTAITQLYGTASGAGQPFVPLAKDPVQIAIDAQLQSVFAKLESLMPDFAVGGGAVVGADGPAANQQLNALLGTLGVDSLQSTDRSSIGDISVGASMQIVNTFRDSADGGMSGVHFRVAVNGTYRIGTGEPASRNRLFDLSTGYGQAGVVAGAAADLRFGSRVTTSAVGSYTAQLGTVSSARVPNAANAIFPLDLATPGTYSAGNVIQLSVIPHYRVAGFLSIDGAYSYVNVGADKFTATPLILPPVPDNGGAASRTPTQPIAPFGAASSTMQQLAIGVSYSSLVAPDRAPGRLPIEVSFQHLETIGASGGPVPKMFRDQIELRVYYRRR